MATKRPVAIDLFCGAGGMSLGFKQAGFRVAGAFDHEQRHVTTYKQNFPSASAHTVDLADMSGDDLRSICHDADDEIDLVFGGPPCQGFSLGGKRSLDDDRNLMIYRFARLVRELEPKYFVMENVQGLLIGHAREVVKSFVHRVRLAGYRIIDDIRVLNAADYGVPQRRKRTFILGYRGDQEAPNYPTPSPLIDTRGRQYNPVVWDAIGDLPCIEKHDSLFDTDDYTGRLGASSHYAKLMRNEIKEDADALPLRPRNGKPLTGCLRTRHSSKIVRRFRKTRPGTQEPISRYYRLKRDEVAPTIRAGTGSDHGSHTSPRPIHFDYPRCITVREAARLHSFPDWYQFDSTRWHAFRQIGNSVPPRLARCVARSTLDALYS